MIGKLVSLNNLQLHDEFDKRNGILLINLNLYRSNKPVENTHNVTTSSKSVVMHILR